MRKSKYKGFWLLSDSADNTKSKKTALAFPAYRLAMLSLSPYTSSGYQVCPMAQKNGCFEDCLFWTGKGGLPTVQQARIERAKLFFEDRGRFFSLLCEDLETHSRKAEKEGQKPCVRLNALSDLQWEKISLLCFGVGKRQSIIETYPQVQFYDYTKIFKRLGQAPSNYHLIFSHSWHYPKSMELAQFALQAKHNVTVIFPVKKGAPLPSSLWGYRVIDGDIHDLRFLDDHPVVVGLRYKIPSNPLLRKDYL